MTLRPGEIREAGFLARFGDVFEHSPWIASAVWKNGRDRSYETPDELTRAFEEVILAASEEQQLALLRAHPDLAVAEDRQQALTEDSRSEQKGAGLDRCSAAEFVEFRDLNARYRAQFGFPFIIAVKGHTRQQILEAFRTRLAHTREQEFHEAVKQVIRIGGFRIAAKFGEPEES